MSTCVQNPSEFSRMPKKACGPNSAKWVCAALDRAYDPHDKIHRLFPVTPFLMLRLFSRNGVSAKTRSASKDSGSRQLEVLRSLVRKGIPVPILIYDNGPHWVIVTGFDGEEFFIWDHKIPDDRIPMNPGNSRVTSTELIRKWNMSWIRKLVPWWRNLYLEVTP